MKEPDLEVIIQLWSPENSDKAKNVNMFLGNISNVKTSSLHSKLIWTGKSYK